MKLEAGIKGHLGTFDSRDQPILNKDLSSL